jgi:RNA polymerase sigma-70 factor (ECF subfamily)
VNQEDHLVERILKGDMKSFESLVYLYKDKIYSFIFKMTLSKEDTDDLVQETFIKVFLNIYKYSNKWKFSTWIYKIAVNSVRNYWKKKKRTLNKEFYCDIPDEFYCNLENNPEYSYEIKENYSQIVKIINKLEYNQKIVFILKYVKDFSINDIADIVGISPETARMRIYRARKKVCNDFNKNLKGGISYEV